MYPSNSTQINPPSVIDSSMQELDRVCEELIKKTYDLENRLSPVLGPHLNQLVDEDYSEGVKEIAVAHKISQKLSDKAKRFSTIAEKINQIISRLEL